MKTNTHTLPLAASKAVAFKFLSDIRNLPKWATQFCKSLREDDAGRYIVATPDGEIIFKIVADEKTGVIDMHGGPNEQQMEYWPARIVERPGAGSLFIFTAMQYPNIADEAFAAQCDALQTEFENISRFVDKN